ncbi:MAG: hypothetical protein K6F34_02450 [Lachnospiraceae bacterium]|nr:hypothetical protein [Lachnospiraceae bacterium]
MRELWASILTTYNDHRGTGKGLALFLVSVLIICIIRHSGKDKDDDRETIGPLWFVISPAAGIAYAFTLIFERYVLSRNDVNEKGNAFYRAAAVVFTAVTLMLSGRLIFSSKEVYLSAACALIPVYIFIYFALAGRLFEGTAAKFFMTACIMMLSIFGYASEYLIPLNMFCGRFSLPSVIVNGVLPLILLFVLGKREAIGLWMNGPAAALEENDYYAWEEEDMKNHKIINSRTLAAALLITVIVLIGSVFVMNRKINNLYETTVNLQQQVNELQQNGK